MRLIVFVFIVAFFMKCAEATLPPDRLNKYCGLGIYTQNASAPCYMLANAYPAQLTSGPVSSYPIAVVEIYPSPALVPLYYNGSQTNLTSGIQPVYYSNGAKTVAELFDLSLTPPALPEIITLTLPACSNASYTLVNGEGYTYEAYDPITGETSTVTTAPSASAECFTDLLYNYEPVCSALTQQSYDMNCASDATSFYECTQNQLLVEPVPPTAFIGTNFTAIGNITVDAASDLMNTASMQAALSICQLNGGTNRYRFQYGYPWQSTEGRGIPGQDIGPPSSSAGTVSYIRPEGCTATGPLVFAVEGVPSTTNLLPISVRSNKTELRAGRIVYGQELQCDRSLPRPVTAQAFQPRLTVAPYCRVAGRFSTLVPAPPSTSYYTGKSGGVIPPANILDGNIVYSITVANLPLGPVAAWTQLSYVYPTLNTSGVFDVVYPKNSKRVFQTLNQSFVDFPEDRALVYVQKFNPYADSLLVASEATVTNIPACNCYIPEDVSGIAPANSRGLLDCDSNYNALLNQQLDYHPQSVGAFSGTRPACSVRLTNGYQNTRNGILASGTYTATATVAGLSTAPYGTLRWRFSTGTPQSVLIVSGIDTDTVTFRVFTAFQVQILELNATNTDGFQTYSTTCSMQLQVYEGAPDIVITPAAANVGVGQPIVFDASGTTSPTGESMTFSWRVIVPDDGDYLNGTGNSQWVQFLSSQVGNYNIELRVANPRVYATQVVTVIVTADPVPINETIIVPSTCQNFFNANGTTNVTYPPFNGNDSTSIVPQPPQYPAQYYTPVNKSPAVTPADIEQMLYDDGVNNALMWVYISLAFIGFMVFLWALRFTWMYFMVCYNSYWDKRMQKQRHASKKSIAD